MYPTRKRWALAMGWVGLAAGCAGVPLVKESLNNDPGALLFNGYSNPNADCYHCHNGDGSGKFLHGPDLHVEVPGATDAEISTLIHKGKSIMPAYEGKLSEAEIATLGTWLRTTYGGGPTGATPAAAPAPQPAPAPAAAPAPAPAADAPKS